MSNLHCREDPGTYWNRPFPLRIFATDKIVVFLLAHSSLLYFYMYKRLFYMFQPDIGRVLCLEECRGRSSLSGKGTFAPPTNCLDHLMDNHNKTTLHCEIFKANDVNLPAKSASKVSTSLPLTCLVSLHLPNSVVTLTRLFVSVDHI